MATQVIGAVRRSRIGVTLIAVALTLALALVVAQASSIWSSDTGTRGASLTHVSLRPLTPAKVTHIPPGCRPKIGCQDDTASGRP
jgi:hypothetical protein